MGTPERRIGIKGIENGAQILIYGTDKIVHHGGNRATAKRLKNFVLNGRAVYDDEKNFVGYVRNINIRDICYRDGNGIYQEYVIRDNDERPEMLSYDNAKKIVEGNGNVELKHVDHIKKIVEGKTYNRRHSTLTAD